MIRLSISRLSKLIWEIIFDEKEFITNKEIDEFNTNSIALEALRAEADYNTGSVSISQAYLLYLITQFFKPKRVIEVGTFIGRSTIAMAQAMDKYCSEGEIFTCDASNSIELPWKGTTKITQFKKQTSVAMFQQLDGVYDFLFLDGRVVDEDLINMDRLITDKSIIVLDDFEGIEKGVINLTYLKKLRKFQNHQLVYPPDSELLLANQMSKKIPMALLVPRTLIHFTNQ